MKSKPPILFECFGILLIILILVILAYGFGHNRGVCDTYNKAKCEGRCLEIATPETYYECVGNCTFKYRYTQPIECGIN